MNYWFPEISPDGTQLAHGAGGAWVSPLHPDGTVGEARAVRGIRPLWVTPGEVIASEGDPAMRVVVTHLGTGAERVVYEGPHYYLHAAGGQWAIVDPQNQIHHANGEVWPGYTPWCIGASTVYLRLDGKTIARRFSSGQEEIIVSGSAENEYTAPQGLLDYTLMRHRLCGLTGAAGMTLADLTRAPDCEGDPRLVWPAWNRLGAAPWIVSHSERYVIVGPWGEQSALWVEAEVGSIFAPHAYGYEDGRILVVWNDGQGRLHHQEFRATDARRPVPGSAPKEQPGPESLEPVDVLPYLACNVSTRALSARVDASHRLVEGTKWGDHGAWWVEGWDEGWYMHYGDNTRGPAGPWRFVNPRWHRCVLRPNVWDAYPGTRFEEWPNGVYRNTTVMDLAVTVKHYPTYQWPGLGTLDTIVRILRLPDHEEWSYAGRGVGLIKYEEYRAGQRTVETLIDRTPAPLVLPNPAPWPIPYDVPPAPAPVPERRRLWPRDDQIVNAVGRIHVAYYNSLQRPRGIFTSTGELPFLVAIPGIDVSIAALDARGLGVHLTHYYQHFDESRGDHEQAIRWVEADIYNSDEAKRKRGEAVGSGSLGGLP